MTTGRVVVLGRKTLETFPGKRPLKNRTNIILSRDASYQAPDAMIAHDIKELAELLKGYPDEDIFIIGGESVYRQLLPLCSRAYVTKIDRAYDADAYFPNLDELPEWRLTKESEEKTYFDVTYAFLTYERLSAERNISETNISETNADVTEKSFGTEKRR